MKPLVVAFVVALALPARAVDFPDESYKALPCRPTIACTADLVPPGVVELEVGYLYRRLGNGADQQTLPFLLKLTLATWAQLQFGSNGQTFQTLPANTRFFDDVTLGIKLHLQDQAPAIPSLSLSATASLPTGAQPGYLQTYDASFVAYVTKDVAWLHFDLNLGLDVWQLDAAPALQPWFALALSVALAHGLGPMIEGYYFADAGVAAHADGGILVALSWSPAHWLTLDAGGDIALVPSTRKVSAFVGATIIPLDLWDSGSERRARQLAREHNER